MTKRNSDNNPWRAIGLAGAVGVDLAVCILLGYWGGRWLSEQMGGARIFVAIGALVGLFVGLASVAFLIRSYLKDTK
jgi:hypothetical protein